MLDERGLVRILGEVRVDGDELLYAYGPEGVAAQQTISSGSSQGVYYPLLDRLGSVRQLTSPSGTVVLSRSYDAFGNIRQQVGNAWSTLGYTGQRHGTADGTIYLRARHYQPDLGRFLQRDSWAGIYGRPQSLNRYSYVENNPMRFSDPTGHWPCLAGFGNCEDSGQTEEQLSQQRSNALDGVQAGIDVVGVVFDGADAINMAIYLGRGDCVNAAISAAAMVPVVGSAVVGSRWIRRGLQRTDNVARFSEETLERITRAREAQQRVGRTPRGAPTYGDVGGQQTRSGWNTPQRAQRTQAAARRARDLDGYNLPRHRWDRDFEGQFVSSHAERQAYEIAPNEPIGISNEGGPCPDCQRYFEAIAQDSGEIQVIAHPDGVTLFHPDGPVVAIDPHENVYTPYQRIP